MLLNAPNSPNNSGRGRPYTTSSQDSCSNPVNAQFRPKLWTWTTQTSNTSKDADGTATVLSPQQPATSRASCHGSLREGAQAGAATPPLLFHGMPALTYKQRSIKPPQKVQYLPVCSSWCYTAQPPPPAAFSPLS